MPLSGQSLHIQIVTVSELKYILDWTRHPIRQRTANGRGSPNLFTLVNKKETRDSSNRSRPPFRKSRLGGDQGGGYGRRRGRFQRARHSGSMAFGEAADWRNAKGSAADASRSCWRSRALDDAVLQRALRTVGLARSAGATAERRGPPPISASPHVRVSRFRTDPKREEQNSGSWRTLSGAFHDSGPSNYRFSRVAQAQHSTAA